MHSPGMRLYALMPRGQFLLLLVQKKVVTQRYAPPVSLSKRISKQVIYCISPRESRRRRVPSCNDRRSGASPAAQVQWGRPGVNRRNEARLHCRSDCSTRRCRHPVVLETHPGKIRIRCAWFQLLIQQAAFVFFCSANALYASTPTFLSSQTQSLKP